MILIHWEEACWSLSIDSNQFVSNRSYCYHLLFGSFSFLCLACSTVTCQINVIGCAYFCCFACTASPCSVADKRESDEGMPLIWFWWDQQHSQVQVKQWTRLSSGCGLYKLASHLVEEIQRVRRYDQMYGLFYTGDYRLSSDFETSVKVFAGVRSHAKWKNINCYRR